VAADSGEAPAATEALAGSARLGFFSRFAQLGAARHRGGGTRRGDRRPREGGGELRRGSAGVGGAKRRNAAVRVTAQREEREKEREERERMMAMVMGVKELGLLPLL
jgi:hypothetical protein